MGGLHSLFLLCILASCGWLTRRVASWGFIESGVGVAVLSRPLSARPLLLDLFLLDLFLLNLFLLDLFCSTSFCSTSFCSTSFFLGVQLLHLVLFLARLAFVPVKYRYQSLASPELAAFRLALDEAAKSLVQRVSDDSLLVLVLCRPSLSPWVVHMRWCSWLLPRSL